ncbi:MAG: ankyrin repeat domain-containing protein [Armatimonadetes bacterium]|nr:ankyrin repeat domain-containing protein [Armatimonadota bacterium]
MRRAIFTCAVWLMVIGAVRANPIDELDFDVMAGHLAVLQEAVTRSPETLRLQGEFAAMRHWTLLQRACWYGQYEIARYLLDQGADVNQRTPMGTALHVAASQGHTRLVRLLLERGADFTLLGNGGATVLQAPTARGHLETVECLLEAGFPVDQPDSRGVTALDVAKGVENSEMIELLLRYGAR